MNAIAERFSRVRVLVVGDVMLDEYLFGAASRISPEAPVPVVEIQSRRYVPGGAGNVAANIASLGAGAKILGVCGTDDAAQVLRSALQLGRVDPAGLISLESRPTTHKTRVVAGQQQIVRLDTEERSPVASDGQRFLLERFEAMLDTADICVFSDYGKGVLSEEFCREAIQLAQERKKPILADPKGLDFEKYLGCTLITPNQNEACQAANLRNEESQQVMAAGARLLEKMPGSAILITRGPEGMTLFREARPPLTITTVARTVFDVVGAGDTAIATLSVSLAAGFDFETSIRLANAAAGIAVARHGTVAVTLKELLDLAEALRILPADFVRETAYA